MTQQPAFIQRTYRFRLYPTVTEQRMLARWFGAKRWVWNHGVERRSKAYRRRGENLTGVDISRAITRLKQTRRYGWLREVPASVITQTLRDLDAGFGAFFAGRARYPRFKKRGHDMAVRLQIDTRHKTATEAWAAGAVFIPGLGSVAA